VRNPLSFLFSRRHQQTKLEQLASRVDVPAIMRVYCTSKPNSRLASAVSFNALYTATHLVHGIIEQGAKLQRNMGAGRRDRRIEWKDAALFEAVAYCHGYLQYCGGHERSTAATSPDPVYDEAMQFSAELSGAVIAHEMVPKLSEEALPLRAAEYKEFFEQKGLEEALVEFEFSLVNALAYGNETAWRAAPPALDFALGTTVGMMVKIDQVSTVSGMIDVSRNLHNKGDELLREWNARR
jgi:hypothetical protein